MDFDDLGLDENDKASDRWREKFASRGLEIVTLASKYRDNQPCVAVDIAGGSFNFCVQVRFEDGVEWMIRFPIPGRAMHPEEKTKQEVATLKFLREKTKIPVPALVAYGMGCDNHLGLGPFIITEFVKGRPLSEVLQVNPPDPSGKILRPDIEDSTLDVVYRQIADILIELSRHDFDKIGSLTLDDEDGVSLSVASRPLTLKMNEMERCGNLTMEEGKG
jgi:aminoglycoside phosphotransferase (APT) family kinase protein